MKVSLILLCVIISCTPQVSKNDVILFEHVALSDFPYPTIKVSTEILEPVEYGGSVTVDKYIFSVVDDFVKSGNTGIQRLAVDDYVIYNVIRDVRSDSSNYVLANKEVTITYFSELNEKLVERNNGSSGSQQLIKEIRRLIGRTSEPRGN